MRDDTVITIDVFSFLGTPHSHFSPLGHLFRRQKKSVERNKGRVNGPEQRCAVSYGTFGNFLHELRVKKWG